jgi:hypothetical protein
LRLSTYNPSLFLVFPALFFESGWFENPFPARLGRYPGIGAQGSKERIFFPEPIFLLTASEGLSQIKPIVFYMDLPRVLRLMP